MKRIIIDLDQTLCDAEGDYLNARPNQAVIDKLQEYRTLGFEVVVYTSRNMRTYNGNVGKINVYTLPVILDWLRRHKIEFDEVVVGKPWCGYEGFYVDDRALRPDEFARMTPEEIARLIGSCNDQ
jgi:capsule biosynthesis phosphatase